MITALAVLALAVTGNIVSEVRSAVDRDDFARAEREIASYRNRWGVTPEMAEAASWIARGALRAGQLDKADAWAAQTRRLVLGQLRARKLDADRRLPIALGASIEVHAQALAKRGERDQALAFLNQELRAWRATSIATRIQKNINLLGLEGKPAPPIEVSPWLGAQPEPLERLKGRPVLLFFWAHWCGDCKAEVPVLARIASSYGPRGLVLIGPTQRYGYVAGGDDAPPDKETSYIDDVRKEYYSPLGSMPVPVSEANFRNYGASTTPTLVLLDRRGIVRLYHPGRMEFNELAAQVDRVLAN